MSAELQNPPDGSENMVILCKIKLINIYVYEVLNINTLTKEHSCTTFDRQGRQSRQYKLG